MRKPLCKVPPSPAPCLGGQTPTSAHWSVGGGAQKELVGCPCPYLGSHAQMVPPTLVGGSWGHHRPLLVPAVTTTRATTSQHCLSHLLPALLHLWQGSQMLAPQPEPEPYQLSLLSAAGLRPQRALPQPRQGRPYSLSRTELGLHREHSLGSTQ